MKTKNGSPDKVLSQTKDSPVKSSKKNSRRVIDSDSEEENEKDKSTAEIVSFVILILYQ